VIAIDPLGTFDAQSDAATLTGTYDCGNAAGFAVIEVNLSQRVAWVSVVLTWAARLPRSSPLLAPPEPERRGSRPATSTTAVRVEGRRAIRRRRCWRGRNQPGGATALASASARPVRCRRTRARATASPAVDSYLTGCARVSGTSRRRASGPPGSPGSGLGARLWRSRLPDAGLLGCRPRLGCRPGSPAVAARVGAGHGGDGRFGPDRWLGGWGLMGVWAHRGRWVRCGSGM